MVRRRIEVDDPYFRDLSARWSLMLNESRATIPDPPRPVRVAAAETAPAVEEAETGDAAVPVPPRRPAELGRSAFPASPKLQAVPIATVELLPPQRPTLSGIY